MTKYNLEVPAIFAGAREINYTSKKTGKQVTGTECTLIANDVGLLTFAFGECKLDFKALQQYTAGEAVNAVLELVKGYQDKPTVALVDFV